MRKIKVIIGDVADEREIEDAEIENYLYWLHLDMELHNRDYPDTPMSVEVVQDDITVTDEEPITN